MWAQAHGLGPWAEFLDPTFRVNDPPGNGPALGSTRARGKDDGSLYKLPQNTTTAGAVDREFGYVGCVVCLCLLRLCLHFRSIRVLICWVRFC